MWLMLYSEVNILCMLVLLTILIRVLKSTGRQRPQRLFALLIVFLIAFFALDLLWGCRAPVGWPTNGAWRSAGSR